MTTRLWPILVLLLAACSQSDARQQDLQSLSSSAATVEMMLSAYVDRSAPEKFTDRALQQSKREQENLLSDLEDSMHGESASSALNAARSLVEVTSQAQAAVARSDRKAAQQALAELKGPAEDLRALASEEQGAGQ